MGEKERVRERERERERQKNDCPPEVALKGKDDDRPKDAPSGQQDVA